MVIHKDELWDSADTIVWVFDAVVYRHNDLEGTVLRICVLTFKYDDRLRVDSALFKLQKLNLAQQFKTHANELVRVLDGENRVIAC